MARQQARLGSCRLNAVRLGDFYPSVNLYINSLASWRPGGAQGILVKDSLEINEAIGDVPATASFEMRDASSPPQQGQAVYIGLGSPSNRLFGGNIIKVSQRQSRYVEMPIWDVECESNHRLMNRRLVTTRIQSVDAGYAIKSIVAGYTSGFTANHVPSGMGFIEEAAFADARVTNVLTKLMNRVGGRWYLDPFSDIHAYVGEETGVSTAADVSATGKQWDWRHARDTSQVRTRIVVRGGSHDLFTTDGIIFGQFLVTGGTYYFQSGVTTLAVNGSNGETYHGVSSFQAASGSPGMGTVYISAGGTPVNAITGGGTAQVYAIIQSTTYQNSLAAVEGGDGIHDYVIRDEKLSEVGALQRGRAELAIYGPIEHTGTYVTRDPSATVGRRVVVNVASPTHVTSVDAKIQRVSIRRFEESTRRWDATRTHLFPQRAVSYSSGAFRDVYQILGDFERSGS